MGSSENEKPKGTINNYFKAEHPVKPEPREDSLGSLGKACEGADSCLGQLRETLEAKRREREAASSDKENKPSPKRQKQSTLKVRVMVTLLG